MKANIHPKVQLQKLTCASCSNVIEVLSTHKNKETSIDICAKCHPFYIGSKQQTSTKGRAEKMSARVQAGLSEKPKKVVKEKSKKQPKAITSLEDL